MDSFQRPRIFPYTTKGVYRGLLTSKYPCWEADGLAREIFTKDIVVQFKVCLGGCLPGSQSFIGFSLFIVGKTPERARPMDLIVSDDKPPRKEAFNILKKQKLVQTFPGFELGHCSVKAAFKDFRPLGKGVSEGSERQF
ncbi:hypothetical protein F5Y16DRAFT_261179 [Xylariaceae sp. FL0255]|nr:hypothetical protein F5Y16DRAFT_261179 [Xylariaceae sp. FL0255]